MLKSMTAFGRSSIDSSFGRLVAEINSVNRKHLEMSLQLPKELARFEIDVRQWVSAVLHRGQVMVRVYAIFENATPLRIRPNLPLARELKAAWDEISGALGVNGAESFHLEMLAHETELFRYEEVLDDDKSYRAALKQAIDGALKGVLEMRQREGQALYEDISARIRHIRKRLAEVAAKAPEASNKYREKLLKALEEALPGATANEERVLREICIFAEKVDIAEEITRMASHLDQFETIMRSEGSVGKTLEFLLQEIHREANTIGSKSGDVEVVHAVVDIKSESERIREQIQNVE